MDLTRLARLLSEVPLERRVQLSPAHHEGETEKEDWGLLLVSALPVQEHATQEQQQEQQQPEEEEEEEEWQEEQEPEKEQEAEADELEEWLDTVI